MTTTRDQFGFFLLGWDPNPKLASVRDYELPESLDDLPLLDGSPSKSLDLSTVRLSLSTGKLPDYINNPLGWSIVSETFLRVFSELACSNIEVLKIPLEERAITGGAGFYVINVTRHVDCLDEQKSVVRYRDSEIVAIPKLVLDPSSIPASCHVFRISGFPFYIVVTREFGVAIAAANVSGVALIGVNSGESV